MSVNPIPTIEDWQNSPAESLAAAGVLAKLTNSHGDAASDAIAFGIAAQVLSAAAPLAGQAIGGPLGALAGAAMAQAAETLSSQHQSAVAELTAGQQTIITQAIAVGSALATAKLTQKASP